MLQSRLNFKSSLKGYTRCGHFSDVYLVHPQYTACSMARSFHASILDTSSPHMLRSTLDLTLHFHLPLCDSSTLSPRYGHATSLCDFPGPLIRAFADVLCEDSAPAQMDCGQANMF